MPPNVDHIEYPAELCAKPLALIGFTGLDTLNNAIHKTVWDTFCSNRRVERAPVTFKLLSSSYEFPIIKPKRNSYEWYIPKGILKRNWMNKHLNAIPAVIVIFYDLDWNDPQWNEKMIECSSRVQSMRAAVEGRNTRITVVLIQQTLPLPANEDILAAERAAALCANCELNTKSLFILPLGDHLQGYTVRLETAFFDLAQNYYHYEARNVKSHRDHLNKTTHQYLLVRHQFKMGFLNELKQDNHTAYKHYTHAYNNLLEVRMVDTNIFEIKTIAGYIYYKLCRLMFNLNLPRDAISQFKAHIDRFKSRVGFRELAFEHYAWLAKQYSMFGDIFDEAVKLGLPAVQTQHPGVYYQLAAQNAVLRKQSCQEVCKDICEYPSPDPLNELETLEFYGQRPWRPGKLSVEPPDPHKEQSGIEALQYLEKQVNHSNIIISLYGSAISQYKTYRCQRMRRRLVIQMADEYYLSKDYGKALTLLTHMLWDYRAEKWWLLISNILQKALNCAYLSANIQDYAILSLEILGEHITIPEEDKLRVFNNLCNILKKKIPEAEKDLPVEEINSANSLWNNVIGSEPLFLSVEMSNIMSMIDCKARFTQAKYEADQKVSIEVFLKSTWFHTIQFSYLSVTINTANYSSEFDAGKYAANPSLSFERNQVKKFLFQFPSDTQDIGQEIQIASVLLHLGEKDKRYVILKFPGTSSSNRNYSELLHFRTSVREQETIDIEFDRIKSRSCTQIMPRSSKVKIFVDHKPPSLLGEWYLISLQVTNAETVSINNVEIKIELEIDEVGSELATEFSSTSNGIAEQLPLILKLSDLNVNATTTTCFYIRSHKTGDRNVSVKLSYLFEADKSITSVKEEMINVPVSKPFDIGVKFFSNRFDEISKLYVDELFLIMPQLKCTSEWPIFIENTVIELNSQVEALDNVMQSQLSKTTLCNDETGAEILTTKVTTTIATNDKPIAIGFYNICWHRVGCTVFNNTRVALKGLPVDEVPLGIESVIPEHGFVRTPMPVSFQLNNRSLHLIQLDMAIDASEAFMFAGYKQIQITILPKSIRKINYNLYPLVPGNVALPKLKLTLSDKNAETLALQQLQLTELLERCLPTHIYIMPQVKGKPVLQVQETASTTEAY